MKYQIQTLTPVHIGSGDNLQHIDGCYDKGKWHRINLDKVFKDPDTNLNTLASAMAQRGFRWTEHLKNPETFATYSLPCLHSPEEVEIREAIKHIDHRPFIPGSTLKGAIRTALLWDLINESDTHYEQTLSDLKELASQEPRGNPRSERPAQGIEKNVLGEDPNHDLLRALQISDTAPTEVSALEMGTAWTVTLDSNDNLVQKVEQNREYKTFVEQIQVKQRLTFSLKLDEWLLKQPAKGHLGFEDAQKNAIQNIAEICNHTARCLMKDEQDFFDYHALTEIADCYDRLLKTLDGLTDGAFITQIGWGSGYNANTITQLFTDDKDASEDLLMDLRERFRLGESRSRRGQYDEREFPKTRRILYRGQNPISPFGWIRISPLGTEA